MIYKDFNHKIKDFATDNRQYFRVDDDVGLQISCINKNYYSNIEEYYNRQLSKESVDNTIRLEEENYLPIAKIVQSKHPEIYEYIHFLENKLKILTAKINALQESSDSSVVRKKINISASGMSFVDKFEYEIGDYIDIRIQLFPEKLNIYIVGKVLRVKQAAIKQSSMAVQFVAISEPNKEALIKHIHNKQLKTLHRPNE